MSEDIRDIEARIKFYCFIVAMSVVVFLFYILAISKIMNNTQFQLKDIIWIIAILAAGYFIFQLNTELSGANQVIKSLEKGIEKQQKETQKKIDSIGLIIPRYKAAADNDVQSAAAFQQEKEQLKDERYENEPYHIDNADSLARLITRRAKSNR